MTSTTCIDRIDIHHHFFPPSLSRVKAAQSRGVGFITPPENLPWSADLSLRAMDSLGIQLAVLSLPSGIAETIDEAKKANVQMHEVVQQHEDRFAFWGCLGDWRDIEGALQLIPYVFDELGAVGIAASSSYGRGTEARYIGDDMYDPIWAALHERDAIVFIHGTQTSSLTPVPHPTLGLPVTEVPHETFKAAAQLVVSGKTRRFSRLVFVLAHMGGSTLALASRVAGLARYMRAPLSEDEILMEFRRYWWDTALSGGSFTAYNAETWGIGDRVLWGSDFPAVSLDTIRWFDSHLEKSYQTNSLRLENVRRNNVLRLFESRGIRLHSGRVPNTPLESSDEGNDLMCTVTSVQQE